MERYKAYSTHLKELYGEKVYKLPVNLPVTCPNRMDGDGCTFCGGVGTGFEAMNSEVSVSEQLNATKGKITKRYKAKKFIAYFQNSNMLFLCSSISSKNSVAFFNFLSILSTLFCKAFKSSFAFLLSFTLLSSSLPILIISSTV